MIVAFALLGDQTLHSLNKLFFFQVAQYTISSFWVKNSFSHDSCEKTFIKLFKVLLIVLMFNQKFLIIQPLFINCN